MTQLYFVATNRDRVALTGRKRTSDLVGPFDSWREANDWRNAWVLLWKDQRARARIEVPISPSPACLEWLADQKAAPGAELADLLDKASVPRLDFVNCRGE